MQHKFEGSLNNKFYVQLPNTSLLSYFNYHLLQKKGTSIKGVIFMHRNINHTTQVVSKHSPHMWFRYKQTNRKSNGEEIRCY